MSTARKLIEQKHRPKRDPDAVRAKDYLKQMHDPKIVKMEVILRFDEPIDEMEMPDLLRDVAEALNQYVSNTGFSVETASAKECTVNPIQPARGSPAGWNFEEAGFDSPLA